MDFVVWFLIALVTFLLAFFVFNELARPKNFPPGPQWFLPFVGNTPLLRKLARECGGQHKAFEKLSEQYRSPVIGLKLGSELVIIGNSYPIVKDIHTREEFDGRPDNFFLRLRTMGTRLGIVCTDGPYWNEQRSFVVRHLRNVGYGKTKMETEIQSELRELLEVIESSNGEPLFPGKELLPPSVINILWTFTTGKRIGRDNPRLHRFLDVLNKRSKAFDMAGGVLSQMPWLRFIAPEKSGYSLICKMNSELHAFFMEIVQEHLDTYTDEKAGGDLIYDYIHEMKSQEKNATSNFTVTQLIMVILDVFFAGSTTTPTTIDLALMITMMRPELQERVVKEIHSAIGTEKQPNYMDRAEMPYVQALLLEVQRFFHILPITGPRRVLKTCELGGYTIPENTTVFIGLRSVHMDPEFWKDPETFRPERFLDENNQVLSTERLTPFGAGKRKCLGDQLAKECIFVFYVGILQKFNLKASKKHPSSLDLLPGITLSPKPYKIIFERR